MKTGIKYNSHEETRNIQFNHQMTFLPSVYIQFKEDNLRATKHGGHADRILDNLKPLNIKLYISNICILFSEAELLATVVVCGRWRGSTIKPVVFN